MPNGHDTDPVTFGRWQEAHAALADRVTRIEAHLAALSPEAVHLRLQTELAELRGDLDALSASTADTLAKRRDRQWTLMLAFLTALALPLVVLAIVALTSAHVR